MMHSLGRSAWGVAAALTIAAGGAGAWAQATTATPAQPEVFRGEVKALAGDQLAIIANGALREFTVSDKVLVIVNARGSLESIKPGSYIATTNASLPDGSGQSVSLSIYEPGMGSAGVNYVMPSGNMMTNGTVARVVANPGASTLEVDYGKGVRTVQVPASSAIILASRGSLESLTPGAKVTVRATQDAGHWVTRIISVGTGGFTPL